jgi:hypothetical protein
LDRPVRPAQDTTGQTVKERPGPILVLAPMARNVRCSTAATSGEQIYGSEAPSGTRPALLMPAAACRNHGERTPFAVQHRAILGLDALSSL